MRAWATTAYGEKLENIELPTPEPQGTEVLLEVTHCGVCHSDLHLWEGSFDLGRGRRVTMAQRGLQLPMVLGHEIVGRVVKLGPDAPPVDQGGVAVGDVRIVYPWIGCGHCDRCRADEDNLCQVQTALGIARPGGYGTHVLAPHPRLLVDFGTLDPALAACAYKLKPKKLEGWDKSCAEYLPPVGTSKPINADVPVTTVHGVKGETHDITIFVCPETNEADCPSTVWWSADEKDCEEKRIAYVAMTRSQGDLIVCVSNDCYSRLLATRRQFVASFECMTINECIDAFREQDGIMIKTDKSISPGEGDQGEEA